MSERVERLAREQYPREHVGYSQPVPDKCHCDECDRTECLRIGFEGGYERSKVLNENEWFEYQVEVVRGIRSSSGLRILTAEADAVMRALGFTKESDDDER